MWGNCGMNVSSGFGMPVSSASCTASSGLRALDEKVESYFSRPRVDLKIDDYLAPPSGSQWLRNFSKSLTKLTSVPSRRVPGMF